MILYLNHIPKDWEYKDKVAFKKWMIKIDNIYWDEVE